VVEEVRGPSRVRSRAVENPPRDQQMAPVVGADAGSKLAKAQSLGVRILDEAALQKILETRLPPDPVPFARGGSSS